MRILNWVQNKLSGKHEKRTFDVGSGSGSGSGSARHSIVSDVRKEEFSDWPQALLSIGTFGNNELKEDPQRHDSAESSRASQDLPDFTLEEVSKLQKELTKLLALKPKSSTDGSEAGGERANLPLNRFLNCPSSLDIDRTTCLKLCIDLDNGDTGDLSPNSKIILNKAKDILADNRNAIKQRSISFLLKKMFVCRSGFAPAPSLRDPIPESRMEKLLRVILHKKMYPQSSATASMKKYLEQKPIEKKRDDGEKMQDKVEDGGKWVKTDSEYIVLEI